MFLKRLYMVITVAIAGLLAGCAGLGTGSLGTESPAQAIFAVKSGYAAALKTAVAYKELPACTPTIKVVCSDPKIVAQIQKADNVAFAAISTAQSAVDTIGGNSATTAVGAAKAALTALTTIVFSAPTKP